MYKPILLLLIITTACQSQSQNGAKQQATLVGGPCEGCEAIYEYGDRTLTNQDTLPGFQENRPKLKVMGTVYESNGETPAENVIIYVYHTNRDGVYPTKGDEQGWARHHGYIRGWMKTNEDGRYTFYTFRPGAYPNRQEPEHIHFTVKEPGKNEYYIESIHFDDDPLLTSTERANLRKRGGSGIADPKADGDLLLIERDIILGLNIPNYQ